jgi:hypothetical protein
VGYRSEVAFIIKFARPAQAKEYYNNNIENILDSEGKAASYMTDCIRLNSRYIIGHFDSFKWYEDCFTDVITTMDFMCKSKDADGFVGYKYCRLGEDDTDSDRKYGGDHGELDGYIDIWTSMRIEFPPDEKEDTDDV